MKTLTATQRNKTGIPGIIYGKTLKENIQVSLNDGEVRSLYKDIKNKEPFTLDLEGTQHTVILQDMQVHVTSGEIQNMDFLVQ